eukprot:m.351930 g.351930  ORF g.351930 m.351930 type:complete len:309 (+) comp16403_c0_seq1:38-964(+)
MQLFLNVAIAVALCVVATSALPAAEVTTPVPQGTFSGSLQVVPYQQSGSGYVCTSCSPVPTVTTMTFYANSLVLNMTGGSTHSCSVDRQGYVISNLQAHSGGQYPYYYVGSLNVNGANVPVCMYFDQSNFRIKIDGQGSCPTNSEPAACVNSGPGSVSQVWSGAFVKSRIPTGTFNGQTNIVPYTRTVNGYTCTTCAPLPSLSRFTWSGDSLNIGFGAVTNPSCSLDAQVYQIAQVAEYGSSYPNYYYGTIYVENTWIPICFYWDTVGNAIFKLDGQGSCPTTSDRASCANGWVSGTVTQVWRATYSR